MSATRLCNRCGAFPAEVTHVCITPYTLAWHLTIPGLKAERDALLADRAALQATVTRLTDALTTLAYPSGWPENPADRTAAHDCVAPIVNFARAALAPGDTAPEPPA